MFKDKERKNDKQRKERRSVIQSKRYIKRVRQNEKTERKKK